MPGLIMYANRPGRGPKNPDGVNLMGSVSSLEVGAEPLVLPPGFRGLEGQRLRNRLNTISGRLRKRHGLRISVSLRPDGSLRVRRVG